MQVTLSRSHRLGSPTLKSACWMATQVSSRPLQGCYINDEVHKATSISYFPVTLPSPAQLQTPTHLVCMLSVWMSDLWWSYQQQEAPKVSCTLLDPPTLKKWVGKLNPLNNLLYAAFRSIGISDTERDLVFEIHILTSHFCPVERDDFSNMEEKWLRTLGNFLQQQTVKEQITKITPYTMVHKKQGPLQMFWC